jgi:Ser/Thr protein kinase RdoA (MazF antagonist)
MSSLIPKREPAWAGHESAPRCDFSHPISTPVRNWLTEVVESNFALRNVEIVGKLRPDDARIGHFRVVALTGNYVAHIKAESADDDLLLAAEFADWLADGAVPVASYVRSHDGQPECVADGLYATLTHFVPGRHGDCSASDAAEVGVGLAALHERAATFGSVDKVRKRAASVAESLRLTQDQVRNGHVEGIPLEFRAAVFDAAQDYTAENFEGTPQCGHGDVSPGNIVFAPAGRAVFCDFEDSAFCYRPRTFDLAMAALRFALEGGVGPDRSSATDRFNALVAAYADASSSQPIDDDAVRRAAKALSDHFLLVLSYLAGKGMVLDDGEWAKAYRWRQLADLAV